MTSEFIECIIFTPYIKSKLVVYYNLYCKYKTHTKSKLGVYVYVYSVHNMN